MARADFAAYRFIKSLAVVAVGILGVARTDFAAYRFIKYTGCSGCRHHRVALGCTLSPVWLVST